MRKSVWGISDQALSSLTNFALSVLVAREVGPHDFGAFAIAFGIYLLLLSAGRAVTSEPLTIRYSYVTPSKWKEATASATGAAVCIGVASGILCVATAPLFKGSLTAAIISLGVALPALLLQDVWRYAFFAQGRGAAAFLNDLVWAITFLLLSTVAVNVFSSRLVSFMLAWGGGAAGAALLGSIQGRILPRPVGAISWWRTHRELASRYLGEALTLAGGFQFALYAVGAVAGLHVVGLVRAGQVLLGPLNILLMGTMLVGVPEAVRTIKLSPSKLATESLKVSLVLSLMSVLWGTGVLLMPDPLGREIVGESWDSSLSTVPGLTLYVAASGFSVGAVIGLRGLAAATRSLRLRLTLTPVVVVCGTVGAQVAGAAGAAWGLAIANTAGAVRWRSALLTELEERRYHSHIADKGGRVTSR